MAEETSDAQAQATAIIDDANNHASATRLAASHEAAQIIQNAQAQAEKLMADANEKIKQAEHDALQKSAESLDTAKDDAS